MSLNRWKVLACTLTVGVGGLAVFATDPTPKTDAPKEPDPLPKLTVKPVTPPGGTDTPAPVAPVKGEEFEITLPVPPAPAAKGEEKKPATEPVFEPVAPPPVPAIIIPASAEVDAKGTKKGEPAKKETEPPLLTPPAKPEGKVKDESLPPIVPEPAKPDAPKPPMIDLDVPEVKTPAADPVAPPMKVAPTAPSTPPVAPPIVDNTKTGGASVAPPTASVVVPGPKPDVPPVVVTPMPTAPESVKVPLTNATPTRPAETAKLKMLLRMGDGQPRFEIRNVATTELLMKVYGEKIEMQAPPDAKSSLAGVTAIGRVRFKAPGIEGTCDHLTILSATGEVLLKGNIHLKTKRGKAWSEMTAEKMVYQIGTAGLAASGTTKVTPASYIPD